MSEKCPLNGFEWSGGIPEVCYDQCEDLWSEAINKNHVDGEYDIFPKISACETHNNSDLEHHDMSLQVPFLRSNVRIVGMTDDCYDCGEEYGAQSFKFECPYE